MIAVATQVWLAVQDTIACIDLLVIQVPPIVPYNSIVAVSHTIKIL